MRLRSAHLRVDRCFFPTPAPAAAPAERIGPPRATSCSRPITSQSMQTRAAVPSASLTGSISVEQGFFAEEGLDVVYHEDNPKGAEGRVKDFTHRWKETQLQQGALEVYPVCEWGAIERVQRLGRGKIIGLDATVRTGAIMVRKESRVHTLADLRNVPIAVTWHAGTFYAAIEAMEAAGVSFDEIKLEHAADRLDALLGGRNEAAALMEPLVSRALEALPQNCRSALARRHRRGGGC